MPEPEFLGRWGNRYLEGIFRTGDSANPVMVLTSAPTIETRSAPERPTDTSTRPISPADPFDQYRPVRMVALDQVRRGMPARTLLGVAAAGLIAALAGLAWISQPGPDAVRPVPPASVPANFDDPLSRSTDRPVPGPEQSAPVQR